MQTRKLEHMIALAETRNFRKAAETVHLSQPALSRSLQALEGELGVELFDRNHGEVIPNAFGRAVCEHARRIQFEVRELDRAVRRIKGLEEGELRVGLGPIVASIVLPGVLIDVVTRYPKLRMIVNVAKGESNLLMLKEDRLDVAVMDTRVVEARDPVSIEELPQHRFAFIVRPQHPLLLIKRPLTPTDLRDYPFGAPTLPAPLATTVRQAGMDEWQTVICDDMSVLLRLAAATDLVAMVSRPAAAGMIQEGSLTELNIEMPFDTQSHIGLLYIAGRTLGPAANLFVELLKKSLGQ